MPADRYCPGSGRSLGSRQIGPFDSKARCPICGDNVAVVLTGADVFYGEHVAPEPVGPTPLLSRQGGPGGSWLLRGGAPLRSGDRFLGIALSDAEMSSVVAAWRAITEPPLPRIPRPEELPREYRVEIVGPWLGWWRYRVTGRGLMDYSERQPGGLPRRSRAAALRAAQARVDRLAQKDKDERRIERREMLARSGS